MSGGSEYRASAADGLPARVSGAWAREKLEYLAKYMSIFNVGIKNKSERVYIDLMAGPGRCVEDDTGDEFDGSPLLAVNQKEPFTETVLVEGDAALAAALRQRVEGRATVVEADCNHTALIEQLRDRLGYGRLGLAFADNLGLDVTLATLLTLTQDRKVDLCITFQVGDLKRYQHNGWPRHLLEMQSASGGWRERGAPRRAAGALPCQSFFAPSTTWGCSRQDPLPR